MKIIYRELALYGGKIEYPRSDNAFFPISQVCNGTVSLSNGGFSKNSIEGLIGKVALLVTIPEPHTLVYLLSFVKSILC